MIRITERIWLGNAPDESHADLNTPGITAILNVAMDLYGQRGWRHGVEYAQVGLIDGPGNPPAAYHAAVLTLIALLKRHDKVVVVCHGGSRSMAVILMHMNVNVRRTWDECVELLHERVEGFPDSHEIHKEAFTKLNWRMLGSLLGD